MYMKLGLLGKCLGHHCTFADSALVVHLNVLDPEQQTYTHLGHQHSGLSLVGGTMALCQGPRTSDGPRAPDLPLVFKLHKIWSVDSQIVATRCQILRLK